MSNADESVEALPPRPVLRVVKGDLTSEELAALVAVIAARNAAAAQRRRPGREAPAERVGPSRAPGAPGASLRPRPMAPLRLGLTMSLRPVSDVSPGDWLARKP